MLVVLLGISYTANSQTFTPNDVPGGKASPGTGILVPPGTREYSPTNCDDLTQPISIQLGLASGSPGSPERVGIQNSRMFRDGIPSTCAGKPYPDGPYSGTFGYHAIQFSNCSDGPVCITINVYADGGSNPCSTGYNSFTMVYQSPDGLDPEPYDPNDLSVNFIGDVGSSGTETFSVTVDPGFFEVVFTNVYSLSQCDVSFNITVPTGDEGAINCTCAEVPVANWALILGAIAIALLTVIRFRR